MRAKQEAGEDATRAEGSSPDAALAASVGMVLTGIPRLVFWIVVRILSWLPSAALPESPWPPQHPRLSAMDPTADGIPSPSHLDPDGSISASRRIMRGSRTAGTQVGRRRERKAAGLGCRRWHPPAGQCGGVDAWSHLRGQWQSPRRWLDSAAAVRPGWLCPG